MVGGRGWVCRAAAGAGGRQGQKAVLTHSQAGSAPPLCPEYDSLIASQNLFFQKPLIFIMLTKYIGETQLKEKLQFLWLIFDNDCDMTIYWKYN